MDIFDKIRSIVFIEYSFVELKILFGTKFSQLGVLLSNLFFCLN